MSLSEGAAEVPDNPNVHHKRSHCDQQDEHLHEAPKARGDAAIFAALVKHFGAITPFRRRRRRHFAFPPAPALPGYDQDFREPQLATPSARLRAPLLDASIDRSIDRGIKERRSEACARSR
mmetsp:Transcript_17254/g.33891  ORF Transcript_17254/g.33891 Transcript_17254/m.33891 type:complete len:121 (-) Transcript_17254:2539-2901(-)